MAHKFLVVACGMVVAASPVSAAKPEPAPAASADAKYCMRVEPATGSLIEKVRCWTREEWADKGIDVDEDWASEGVAIIDEDGRRQPKG